MAKNDGILFVHSSDEMYGADRMLLEVLSTVPSLTSVHVWIPDDATSAGSRLSDRLREEGISYSIMGIPVLRRKYLTIPGAARTLWNSFRVLGAVRRAKPSVLFCATSAVLLVAPIARIAGVKSIVLYNQEIWSGGEARILRLLTRACTSIVAISNPARDSLGASLVSRAAVIPNAVPDRRGAGSELSEHTGPLVFLMASRWNSWKGHETLLDAWNVVDTPGRLVILGSAPSGGNNPDVPKIVERLRFPESVTVVGETADIGSFIEDSDFVVVPSDLPEPFGLIAAEAFARGRPVIASRGGGLADIVSEGETGRLFTPRSRPELTSILESVTRESAVEMGARARETYLASFSLESFRTRFAAFWVSIAKGTN